jgi:8-amino-7-oxononanoate synthase
MTSPLVAPLAAGLADLAVAGRFRIRRTVESRRQGSVRVRVDGNELLAFCSNDYLGLADHSRVTEAFVEAAREWGVGSGASHLVSGHCAEHHELEQELAEFTGRERALLFSTGYMANLAVVTTLLGRGDRVFEDRLNHASLLDAGLASGARLVRYPHADVAALAARLTRPSSSDDCRTDGALGDPRCLVVTDGVFSMDGDTAPLAELATTCREHDAWLFVDDAHGLGVLGATGRGSVEAAGLGPDDVPILMGTLGKAFGTFGAFVAGSNELVETLLQKARTYIYTTALPAAVAAAARAALRVAQEEPWRRERVLEHSAHFRRQAQMLGLALIPSRTPIQPLVLGSESAAVAASEFLRERGLWVPAIRPPTVPAGASRLRITFSAAHERADVDRLLQALAELPVCDQVGDAGRSQVP